jgi:hypothetical protein
MNRKLVVVTILCLLMLLMLSMACVDGGGDDNDTISVRKTAAFGEQEWEAQLEAIKVTQWEAQMQYNKDQGLP